MLKQFSGIQVILQLIKDKSEFAHKWNVSFKKPLGKLGMLAHAFNPSAQRQKQPDLLWVREQPGQSSVPGQPGLPNESLS